MIKSVVFDLDHTLFDRYETLKCVAPLLKERFKINPKYSVEEIAEKMIYFDKNFVHFGWVRLQKELIKSDLIIEEIGLDDYRKFVMGKFMTIAIPYNFTSPMLQILKNEGYKLGLITNGNSELQRSKLKILDLNQYFDYIYVGGEHELQKPNIEPFLETASALDLKPCECVYVGDNPINDIEASRKAGFLPIHVQTTGNWTLPEIEKPKYSVKTVAEIPELIKKINREQ